MYVGSWGTWLGDARRKAKEKVKMVAAGAKAKMEVAGAKAKLVAAGAKVVVERGSWKKDLAKALVKKAKGHGILLLVGKDIRAHVGDVARWVIKPTSAQ